MNGAPSHTLAAVIRSECERVLPGSDPQIIPIKVMSALFIAYPIAFGIPEGAGIEANHAESGARQPLQENTAAGAHAHDDVIHFFPFRKAMHGRLDPLNRTEHVRFSVGRLKLSEERRFQCVPPWPGEPKCSTCPPTGSYSPETELSGASQS